MQFIMLYSHNIISLFRQVAERLQIYYIKSMQFSCIKYYWLGTSKYIHRGACVCVCVHVYFFLHLVTICIIILAIGS